MMMRDIRSLLAVVGLMAMAVGCNGPTDVTLTPTDVRTTCVDPDRYDSERPPTQVTLPDLHMDHPEVVLTISDVVVEPVRSICTSTGTMLSLHQVGFQCVISVDNHTGETLNVTTEYGSPFEGLVLVATGPDGEQLYRGPHAIFTRDHDPGATFPLPPGRTSRKVVFHRWPWPWEGPETVRLRLVGDFAGAAGVKGLESNTVTVAIQRDQQ